MLDASYRAERDALARFAYEPSEVTVHTDVRLAPREGRAELDEAWAVRVLSLNDVTRFDVRPSWRVRFGAATVRDAGCDACLAGQAELGAGFTRAGLLGVADLYAGADVSAESAAA